MDYAKIKDDIDHGRAVLYDVRTPEEYSAACVVSAANWPLQDMQAGKLPDETRAKTIYTYCRSGNRSAYAAQLLYQAGYTHVVNLGGIDDVCAMGGELAAE